MEMLGLRFETAVSEADEHYAGTPAETVAVLSRRKAEAVAPRARLWVSWEFLAVAALKDDAGQINITIRIRPRIFIKVALDRFIVFFPS